MKRRDFAINSVAAASLATLPLASLAQKRKDAVVLGMTLEPTGLDPTAGAASAIAEIVQYNVFETLTKVNSDGSVTPLLAESWEVSPDAPPAKRAPTRTSARSPRWSASASWTSTPWS